jgi:Arc/MetJ family transcription regulator
MSTTQIELDQNLLAEAAAILGTKTKKATVNEALRQIVVRERQLRHLQKLADGALPDLRNPEIMARAWQ